MSMAISVRGSQYVASPQSSSLAAAAPQPPLKSEYHCCHDFSTVLAEYLLPLASNMLVAWQCSLLIIFLRKSLAACSL